MAMVKANSINENSVHPYPAAKRMLIGSGIALVLIVLFLSGVNEPDPEWPQYWYIKPMLMVPAAGAMGGLLYHLMDHLRFQGGWIKVLGYAISILGYIIAIWMGTVLGLNGTLWN